MDIEVRKPLRRYKGSTLKCGPGKTEQAHKRETDMNYILRDYAKTGLIKHAQKHQGTYDDVTVDDFQEAMFLVTSAQNMFNDLPGQIKKRFNNDPAEFLGFVQNPENVDEMSRLGILKGNDGIDINGTQVNVPTKAHYDEKTAPADQTPAPAGEPSAAE